MRFRESRALDLFAVILLFLCCQIHSAATSPSYKCNTYACAAGNSRRSDLGELGIRSDESHEGEGEGEGDEGRGLKGREPSQLQHLAAPRSMIDKREDDDDSEAPRDYSSGTRLRDPVVKKISLNDEESELGVEERSREDRLRLIERILTEILEMASEQKKTEEDK